jgi:predicted ATP-dependent serine protease
LHSFRQQIGHQTKSATNKKSYKCSNCGTVSYIWLGRCGNCGEWNTQKTVQVGSKPVVKTVRFEQEVSMEYILEYLKYRSVANQPAKIYYKDDRTFRVFYSFTFDNTYLHIPGTKGYGYKYRLDRIRNVEL